MPVAFFKCKCGTEQRTIVPMDHTHDVYDEKKRRWFFDPKLSHLPTPTRTITCAACGGEVEESTDPKAVPTRFHFNWMADD